MNRLLCRGTSLGATFVLACFVGGTAYADDTADAAKSAAAPAAAPTHMTGKPAMSKHYHQAMHREEMSLAMRKQIQIALNSHGAMLKVDGMLGKKSCAALKKYQSENGLKATGMVDKATLEKLGVK